MANIGSKEGQTETTDCLEFCFVGYLEHFKVWYAPGLGITPEGFGAGILQVETLMVCWFLAITVETLLGLSCMHHL